MLKFLQHAEIRAYFHPTELFRGEIGQKSWEVARQMVKPVREAIAQGHIDVPPLLAVYNCYNAAKSPNADPQQISDPMIVFEYINFAMNSNNKTVEALDEEESKFMPVASYSPAIVKADRDAT